MPVIPLSGNADNSIKVIAYDFISRAKIDRYESIQKAARKLFIKNPECIYEYIKGNHHREIKSYKTQVRYHFEYDIDSTQA